MLIKLLKMILYIFWYLKYQMNSFDILSTKKNTVDINEPYIDHTKGKSTKFELDFTNNKERFEVTI